jgi:hypothetical protein
VFVPIYNIDGHEATSRWNFPALRGPSEKGHVANARGINLRDYAKADAPETRAMIALLRRLDPDSLCRLPCQRPVRHAV